MAYEVLLRDVTETDLPIFFKHQIDPQANEMAAFPPRNEQAFLAHWKKILANKTNIIKTILFNGQVAGNIVSFEGNGQREVGYWLGKEYWGQGIATRALSAFLDLIQTRPLYAYVARHNTASIRVLEKCGFARVDEIEEFSNFGGQAIEGLIFKLA